VGVGHVVADKVESQGQVADMQLAKESGQILFGSESRINSGKTLHREARISTALKDGQQVEVGDPEILEVVEALEAAGEGTCSLASVGEEVYVSYIDDVVAGGDPVEAAGLIPLLKGRGALYLGTENNISKASFQGFKVRLRKGV
jgi:hypothetical protein